LFNLEVEVSGGNGTGAPVVAARGLSGNAAPAERLSYSAPSADASGAVEVRNQRGQVQQAATARAQQQAATQAPAASTGAFGQKLDDGGAPAAAPVNRAQRRAQEKGKR
jgi:preprotein translocase subunit SecA